MKTKKLLALLLCLCMAAAFWPAAALAETSQPTLVTSIEVTMIKPAVGKSPNWDKDAVHFKTEPADSVWIRSLLWARIAEEDYNGTDADNWWEGFSTDFSVFEPVYYYAVFIGFVAEEGYAIAETVTAKVNCRSNKVNVSEDNSGAVPPIVFSPLSPVEESESVLVTHIEAIIPEPAVGEYPAQGISDSDFSAKPNGSVRFLFEGETIAWHRIAEADYTGTDEVHWEYWEHYFSQHGVFEPDYYYRASIAFVEEEGYAIAETVKGFVNGQPSEVEVYVGEGYSSATLFIVFGLLKGELHIIRASIDAPVRGEKPATEPSTFEATPADSVGFDKVEWKKIAKGNYNIIYLHDLYYAYEGNWERIDPDSDTFEDGFYYAADMYFVPAEETTIPETVIGAVDDERVYNVYQGPYTARLRMVFEPLEGLEEITSVDAAITVPAPGAKPDTKPTFTAMPADSVGLDPHLTWSRIAEEKYTGTYRDAWEWLDPDSDMLEFEYGYYYRAYIDITTKGGYRFAETADMTVNDRPSDGTHVETSFGKYGAWLSIVFEPLHTHTAGTKWEHDETQHWNLCTADDGEKMNLAAHTPGDWIIDTPATVEMEGTKHKECTVCKRTLETGTIPPTGSEHEHSYGSEWKHDSDNHWKECACGEKTDMAAHSFMWKVDKAATVADTGLRHEECTVCGAKRNEKTVIARLPARDNELPETGMLWWPVPILLLIGLALLLIGFKAKRSKQ